jgi:hypothetical protein
VRAGEEGKLPPNTPTQAPAKSLPTPERKT